MTTAITFDYSLPKPFGFGQNRSPLKWILPKTKITPELHSTSDLMPKQKTRLTFRCGLLGWLHTCSRNNDDVPATDLFAVSSADRRRSFTSYPPWTTPITCVSLSLCTSRSISSRSNGNTNSKISLCSVNYIHNHKQLGLLPINKFLIA